MEITNRTGIEKKPSWTEVSFLFIGLLVFYPTSRVTPYPFPTFCASHDVSFELPGGNERDSGITGWENMGMGFKFQMGMGMGWEWEWSHWNGRELVWKICSRTPLLSVSHQTRRWSNHADVDDAVSLSSLRRRNNLQPAHVFFLRRRCHSLIITSPAATRCPAAVTISTRASVSIIAHYINTSPSLRSSGQSEPRRQSPHQTLLFGLALPGSLYYTPADTHRPTARIKTSNRCHTSVDAKAFYVRGHIKAMGFECDYWRPL